MNITASRKPFLRSRKVRRYIVIKMKKGLQENLTTHEDTHDCPLRFLYLHLCVCLFLFLMITFRFSCAGLGSGTPGSSYKSGQRNDQSHLATRTIHDKTSHQQMGSTIWGAPPQPNLSNWYNLCLEWGGQWSLYNISVFISEWIKQRWHFAKFSKWTLVDVIIFYLISYLTNHWIVF